MSRRQSRYVRVDPGNPQAAGQCDRCGFWFNQRDLVFQDQWAGTKLYNTGALVCRSGNGCYDTPQEQLRTIILPPDPLPILNARTPNFLYEEQTVRIIEFNAPPNPPWGAGPQTLRALQEGETPRLLEYSSEANDGRITSQPTAPGNLSGAEIMEIVLAGGTQVAPADGRLTSLPVFPGTLTGVELLELIATGRGNAAGTTENATIIPLDGRLTSLQAFLIELAGTEVMELVMPNNAQTGQNYQITTAALALFFSAYPYINATIIVSGGSPYLIKPTDTRILVDKAIPSATFIVAPLASAMAVPFPILIKDFAGNASSNNITISFSGGEECDGETEIIIGNDFGWTTINPAPGGGAWYLS